MLFLILKIYLAIAVIGLVATIIRIIGNPILRGKKPFWVAVLIVFFCLIWPYLVFQVIMQVRRNVKIIKQRERVR
jgi:hypothetical protein